MTEPRCGDRRTLDIERLGADHALRREPAGPPSHRQAARRSRPCRTWRKGERTRGRPQRARGAASARPADRQNRSSCVPTGGAVSRADATPRGQAPKTAPRLLAIDLCDFIVELLAEDLMETTGPSPRPAPAMGAAPPGTTRSHPRPPGSSRAGPSRFGMVSGLRVEALARILAQRRVHELLERPQGIRNTCDGWPASSWSCGGRGRSCSGIPLPSCGRGHETSRDDHETDEDGDHAPRPH